MTHKSKPKELNRLPLGVIQRLIKEAKLVDKGHDTPCWEREGYRDENGYGQMWAEGRAHWIHRVSYACFNGTIPEGMTIDHECKNSSCFNPDHLTYMTISDNSKRRHDNGDEDIPI